MRIIVLLLIYCVITFSTANTIANADLLGIKEGTLLQYKIQYASSRDNYTENEDLEFYKLRNINYQVQVPNLSNDVKDEEELTQYIEINTQDITFDFHNSSQLTVSEISINPFFPGSIVIVRDWQYFHDFGEIYECDLVLDQHGATLYFFSIYDNGFSFDINMGALKAEFFNDSSTISAIENYNEYSFSYDKSTGVLVNYYFEHLIISYSQLVFNSTYDEVISVGSETLLSRSYKLKYLSNYEEILYPSGSNIEKSNPIDKDFAYSLLAVVLTFSIYIERKKWN